MNEIKAELREEIEELNGNFKGDIREDFQEIKSDIKGLVSRIDAALLPDMGLTGKDGCLEKEVDNLQRRP